MARFARVVGTTAPPDPRHHPHTVCAWCGVPINPNANRPTTNRCSDLDCKRLAAFHPARRSA